MIGVRKLQRYLQVLCAFAICGDGPVQAQIAGLSAGQYALEAQMVLPHLDEMRRMSEQHTVCVDEAGVETLFPVFLQPAFIGCALVWQGADADSIDYVLQCNSVNGASGTAHLKIDADVIRGELKAKMGGKNMTFSQYVQAQRQGACPLH